MYRKKYAVIGGDMRNAILAQLLREDGAEVKTYGLKNAPEMNVLDELSLETAVRGVDAVIGPLPFSSDNVTLRAPYAGRRITNSELFEAMGGGLLIAGKTEAIKYIGEDYGIHVRDILEREEMSILNAIPTAEGAIQLAMEKLPITIHGATALVIGYGRIGKILARLLSALGADVYVTARKFTDYAWIESFRYRLLRYEELEQGLGKMDVIFNTVPTLILDDKRLESVKNTALIIDLASKPGGVDFKHAESLGIQTEWALSLPGKVAPRSAAKYMKDTIYNIIEEAGEEKC